MTREESDYPLIRELELGKSLDNFLEEHFHEDIYVDDLTYEACCNLASVMHDVIVLNERGVRFGVKTDGDGYRIVHVNGPYETPVCHESCCVAWEDCWILNGIVDRLYGRKDEPRQATLPQKEYAARKGKVCPYCGSTSVVVLDEVTTRDRDVIGCRKCGSIWLRALKSVVSGFQEIDPNRSQSPFDPLW